MSVLKQVLLLLECTFRLDFPDLTDQFSRAISITYDSTFTPRQCGLVQDQGHPGILLWLATLN